MVYIHLNWCLEGCTEWRWMRSNLVQVLDRRIERERQAMFWHTWLENRLSEFSISGKAACHPLCTSKEAQGGYDRCPCMSAVNFIYQEKNSRKEVFLFSFLVLFNKISDRALNNKFRHPRASWFTKASLVFFSIPLHVVCQSCFLKQGWQEHLSAAQIIPGNLRSNYFTSVLNQCHEQQEVIDNHIEIDRLNSFPQLKEPKQMVYMHAI